MLLQLLSRYSTISSQEISIFQNWQWQPSPMKPAPHRRHFLALWEWQLHCASLVSKIILILFPTSYHHRPGATAHFRRSLFKNFRLIKFLDIGAAYGTAKSGVGIASMGVMNPGLVMRNIIPVVMAGVLGIYGLIVAVIIQGSSKIITKRIQLRNKKLITLFSRIQ